MNRRKFLSTTASVTAIAIAGCTGSGSNDTPERVTEAVLEATLNGDYETAQSLVINDMDGKMTESYVAEQSALAERGNAEIVSVELHDQDEEQAQVDVVVVSDTAVGAFTTSSRYHLIKEDGEWLVERFEEL